MYTAKDEDVFIYFGKDKTKRHKLDAILAKEFRHLRDPSAHIPIPPETEGGT